MYFLIDYENVNYAGLEGTEFLEKNDVVSFFYSDHCDKIISYRMKDIEKSGCAFEICKLKNVRKNGLDFYIASKVGEIFAMDRNAKIAIVSADNGFQALLDYWKPRLLVKNQLVKCKTIAKSLMCVYGETTRKALVKNNIGILDLQEEFVKYEERKRIVTKITDLFSNTDYENLIFQIVDVITLSDKPQVLYLNSLKSFGRKTGTEVYRKIKNYAIGT